MKIIEINPAQQQTLHKDLNWNRPREATTAPKDLSPSQRPQNQDDSVKLRTDTASYALRKFDTVNAAMNAAANSIRIADEAMQNIGAKIDGMKVALTKIVKQYPPFPPGSEDRIALLKSFFALRQEIDALTFPTDDTGAQHILSGTVQDGDLSPMVDLGEDHFEINVHKLQVNAGPEGLNIPDLPTDAADDQIRQTLRDMSQAHKILEAKRDLLAEDARRITRLQ